MPTITFDLSKEDQDKLKWQEYGLVNYEGKIVKMLTEEEAVELLKTRPDLVASLGHDPNTGASNESV